MGRRALRRGGLTAAVSTTVLALMAGTLYTLSGPVDGAAAQAAGTVAATTTEITLADPKSDTPRAARPLVAGETGFLSRQAKTDGLQWTDYSDGTSVTVSNASGVYTPGEGCTALASTCRTAWYGSDGDLVALPKSLSSRSVTLWDPETHALSTVASSNSSNYYRGLAGETVVTTSTLIDFVDGERRERDITGAATSIGGSELKAADSSGVLWAYGGRVYYIDLATAVNTEVFTDVPTSAHFVQSADRIGWSNSNGTELHLKSRTDLTAAEQVITLPDVNELTYLGELGGNPALVDDQLLLPITRRQGGEAVKAVSIVDGSYKTLLARSGAYTIQAAGDDALVTGGTGPADWWVQRVSQAEDGSLKLSKLRQVPPEENAKTGIALSRGNLRVAEDDPGADASNFDTTSVRTLTTDGAATLTASAATESVRIRPACPYTGTTCAALWGNTTGFGPRDVYLDTVDGDDPGSGNDTADKVVSIGYVALEFGTEGGTIVDVSDDYAVYNSGGTSPMQYVGEYGQGQRLKRSIRTAALGGSTLWSATTTAGKLTSYSLTENRTLATVTVPSLGCVPSELQAAGRWLYWSCGTDSAGVYDTKARTSRAVQPGDVLLGDGFTVRHDHDADQLILTDAATGTTRVIASGLPDSGLAVDRRYRWTVDEYTGLVAWFDAFEQTHVATTGITPSALTTFEAETDFYSYPASSAPWYGRWILSRPVTSWTLTLTSVQSGATGRATRTITGSTAATSVTATWNGRTASGSYFPNGTFKWTLKATALGTTTATTATSGSGYLFGGAAVRHDFGSLDSADGRGDLLTLSSSGALTVHTGTGTGRFTANTTGTGWATTAKVVPFGDLSGDRCNDVLVRLSNGALRLYKPGCYATLKPSTSYTTLATSGWTQYDILTSPGDVSGDGRPDLIARNTSTGAVYLFKGTSTGKLSARVKLYANWKTYKKIVGVGDLNGDGVGDLIAQDKSNTLYRYDGTGTGTGGFKARVKLFGNWGGSYNAVVGVGDITDDGNSDLVSRDTSGNLYRNNGDGKGSFGARVKIASGWKGYKSLS
ncbi:FG-GAP repeat domain-containing protein [Streptomyces geranii]|uniref:FG-GAP repeat domain-containing protein n=1 Tax=Streptomyces geranii TaxID=2058923 RepID=UPI000D04409C|nr:VCBS repeat-containing protein [Streptomyces geranii]